MRCKHCGAALPRRGKLCAACGAQAVTGARTRHMRCRRCGRRVPAAVRLCPACGARLRPSWRWLAQLALLAMVAGGGYYLAAGVLRPLDIRQRAERLWEQSLAALLPPPTPTYPPLPTATSDVRPTPSRIPTATPFRSPTPTATATATTVPTLTATVAPTMGTPALDQPAETSEGAMVVASTAGT